MLTAACRVYPGTVFPYVISLISIGVFLVSRYYAHSLPGRPIEEWEPLEEHLQAVADLAGKFADKFDAAESGRAASLGHDVGR